MNKKLSLKPKRSLSTPSLLQNRHNEILYYTAVHFGNTTIWSWTEAWRLAQGHTVHREQNQDCPESRGSQESFHYYTKLLQPRVSVRLPKVMPKWTSTGNPAQKWIEKGTRQYAVSEDRRAQRAGLVQQRLTWELSLLMTPQIRPVVLTFGGIVNLWETDKSFGFFLKINVHVSVQIYRAYSLMEPQLRYAERSDLNLYTYIYLFTQNFSGGRKHS